MSNNGSPPPKPEGDGPKQLNIKVKDDKDNEVFFKIKFTTPLDKVIQAYCDRQGVAANTQRFFFDNVRINAGDTPLALEMEDGDMIEVHQEQLGGDGGSATPEPKEKKDVYLMVKVKDQNNCEIEFRIKPTTALSKVMTAYCKTKEIDRGSVRFLHDGERLTGNETASSRELVDGDTIHAMMEQLGGC